jgi:hypothetical protein
VIDDESDKFSEVAQQAIKLMRRCEERQMHIEIIRECEDGPDGKPLSPVVAVFNRDLPDVAMAFYKMYGASPYWGILITNRETKTRIALHKVIFEDLEKLIFDAKKDRLNKMLGTNTRHMVIGDEVVESETGPFLSNGDLEFSKVHPNWVVLVDEAQEPKFYVPDDEEYPNQKIAAYERKYNKFCRWMVQQLT